MVHKYYFVVKISFAHSTKVTYQSSCDIELINSRAQDEMKSDVKKTGVRQCLFRIIKRFF